MARLERQNFQRLPSTASTITGRDATLSPSLAESNIVDDTESIETLRGPILDAQNAQSSDHRQIFEYSFDQDLNTSRPYTRAMQKHTVWSTTSSKIHTMGWSCLSGLSLAEVSHISITNLPFCPQELWNGHHYLKTRLDRGALIFSECRHSSMSDPTQGVPTFRRRPHTMRAVPAAARTMLLTGMFQLRITKDSLL